MNPVAIIVLAARLLALPDTALTPAMAIEASAAAIWYADGPVTPELLSMVAWSETRFTFDTPNPRHCGVTQVPARDAAECRALAAKRFAAYADTVDHIGAWLRFCRVDAIARRHRDRLSCAMAGYATGWRGARAGSTPHSRHVLWLARQLATGGTIP